MSLAQNKTANSNTRLLPFKGAVVAALATSAALTISTVAAALILPSEVTQRLLPFFYMVQLIGILGSFAGAGWRLAEFIRPTILTIVYISCSLIIGGIFFSTGAGIFDKGYPYYTSWSAPGVSYALVSLSIFSISAAAGLGPQILSTGIVSRGVVKPTNTLIVCGFLFVLLLATLPFNANLVPLLRTVLCSGIIVALFSARHPARWPISLGLVLILAAVSSFDKRNAIFLLAAIVLAYVTFRGSRGSAKISLKTLLIIPVSSVFIFILVVAMSIVRGYGGFGVSNIFDAIQYIPIYLSNSNSIQMLSNNFELGYVFFHLHNAVESIIKFPELIINGESFLKLFFIGVPAEVFGFKPISILESYTRYWDSTFRQRGGSLPITIIGEAVWNFGYFAPIVLFPLYLVIDRIFLWLRSRSGRGLVTGALFLVYFQYTWILARGSGLDIAAAYFLVAIVFALTTLFPISAFLNVIKSR